MKILENITSGYKKIATGIAIVSVLALMYIALIPGGINLASAGIVGALGGSPIEGALVKIVEWPQYNATTNATGAYTISDVPVGTYNLSASKEGYATNISTVTVLENSTVNVDFTLSPANYKYFAAGAIEPNVDVYLEMSNPSNMSASVEVMFMMINGSVITLPIVIPENTTKIINPKDTLSVPSYFSTKIVSDREIAADRMTVFADYASGGSTINEIHETLGASELNTTWYFAAGAADSVTNPVIQILNPNPQNATVTAQFMLINGTTVNRTKEIPATSRGSISPWDVLSSPSYFSTKVVSDIPIMTERTTVFTNQTINGNIVHGVHNTIGATELATTWYFAAGAVESNTNMAIQILNPNSQNANVTAEFMLTNGTIVNRTITVLSTSRGSINPKDVLSIPSYFSTRVTSDIPVMIERTVTFVHTDVGGGKFINGYHNTIGSTKLSTKWSIGGGYIGPGISSSIMILNPNTQAVNLTTKFMLTNGTVIMDSRQVTANSRSSINSGTIVPNGWYSAQVTGDIPIFVEKTDTFAGVMWNGRYVDGYGNTIGISV